MHTERSDGSYTFTVFTPTYNRVHVLQRVYESLARQTYRNFEWLIVDDGSTDGTVGLVKSLARKSLFPVNYIWKPNGGVHTAVNVGVRHARGMFFAILDSDDWYVKDALENMLAAWNSIEEGQRSKYCGVCGLCTYENGNIVGSRFPSDVWDSNDFDAKNVYRIVGDKKGCKRTDVMRQFPFPENVGRFVPESTVWNRVGRTYSTRFVNTVFAVVQYQAGGLSGSKRINLIQNPRAMVLLLSELLACRERLPFPVFLKSVINLIRFSLHAKVSSQEVCNSIPNKVLILPCAPVAVALVLRDRILMRGCRNR
jgi:glycosyltransferase involved in cell wall biosynthesis